MKVMVIVQARMTSSRLPGKVLMPVLGRPLLAIQLERLKACKLVQGIVVATTQNSCDDALVNLARSSGVFYFRGDENDVLSRYYGAAKLFGAEVVVRVTADCPLIDPRVVDRVIRYYLDHADRYDYVSNVIQRTYPRGMDTEVFPFSVLEKLSGMELEPRYREHVTAYLYQHPAEFRLGGVEYERSESGHRWTVDTPQDFELIRRMLEALYEDNPLFSLEDALTLLQKHPAWSQLNAEINQKEV